MVLAAGVDSEAKATVIGVVPQIEVLAAVLDGGHTVGGDGDVPFVVVAFHRSALCEVASFAVAGAGDVGGAEILLVGGVEDGPEVTLGIQGHDHSFVVAVVQVNDVVLGHHVADVAFVCVETIVCHKSGVVLAHDEIVLACLQVVGAGDELIAAGAGLNGCGAVGHGQGV